MIDSPEGPREFRDDRPGRSLEVVTSTSNPTIKLARSLHRRRMRYRERALLIEGPRAIETAVDHGAHLRVVLLDASRIDDHSPPQRFLLSADRVMRVDTVLFREIADTENPQPVMAIASMPERTVPVDCSLVLAVDGVRDPGNLGTLIRSAAAAGVDAVALLPGSVDPTNLKVVRSSAGAIYAIPVVPFADIGQIVDRAFQTPPQVVLAEAGSDTAYDAFDWEPPSVLVIGSEGAGAGETTRTFATAAVAIPMAQGIESLNAAVSGSILLFEATSQRRR